MPDHSVLLTTVSIYANPPHNKKMIPQILLLHKFSVSNNITIL